MIKCEQSTKKPDVESEKLSHEYEAKITEMTCNTDSRADVAAVARYVMKLYIEVVHRTLLVRSVTALGSNDY